MHCHNAAAPADRGSTTPRISRPPCGTHAAVTALDLAPLLPSDPPPSCVTAPRVDNATLDSVRVADRTADPPDTPPPDTRA